MRWIPLLVAAAALPPLFGSCASTSKSDEPVGVPGTPIGNTPLPDPEFGKYLLELSNAISQWVEQTWSASTTADARKQDLLGTWISERAHRRQADLLRELETGPVQNRIIAAAALGFTRSPEALSPLLAALHDQNDKVRSNALLGLTILQSPDTPPGAICEILSRETDSKLRWSAVYCLRSLAEVGVTDSCMRRSGRLALSDTEPMVRSQAALVLGILDDVDSIPQIAALLYDSFPLVSASASRAIARLGKENDEHRGAAARALVRAMDEGDRDLRTRILPDLISLSGHNYATDTALWKAWAARLP